MQQNHSFMPLNNCMLQLKDKKWKEKEGKKKRQPVRINSFTAKCSVFHKSQSTLEQKDA